MGRTFALFDQSTYAPQDLAAILVAVLGNRLPTQNFLTGAGAGYLLIVLLTFGTAWSTPAALARGPVQHHGAAAGSAQ